MEQKMFDWLKADIDKVDKKVDTLSKEVNTKLDEILAFKWQIVGGSVVISAVVGVVIQIFLAAYSRS